MTTHHATVNRSTGMLLLAAALMSAACNRSPAPSSELSEAPQQEKHPPLTLAEAMGEVPPVPQGAKLFLQDGFDRIEELRLSPNRKRIAVVGEDIVAHHTQVGVVDPSRLSPTTMPVCRLFNCESQSQLAEFERVKRVVWSSDSNSIAAVAHHSQRKNPATGSSLSEGLVSPKERIKLRTDLNLDRETYDVRLYDCGTRDWKWTVGSSSDPILAVGFAENDRQVVAVVHVRQPQELESNPVVELNASAAAILKSQPRIEFKFYRADSGDLVKTVKGPEVANPAAVVSPDGTSVALWDQLVKDTSVMVVDSTSGEIRFRLNGHLFGIGFEAVTFSPSGRYLATSALGQHNAPAQQETTEADGKIHLWDANTGAQLQAFPGTRGSDVSFSHNESQFATHRAFMRDDRAKYEFMVWSIESASVVQRREIPDDVSRVVFYSDDELLTAGTTSNSGSKFRILNWDSSSSP